MPKGHKLIDWTAENDARLMLTILAVENVHPNCEAVAAAFGAGLDAQAIKNRLSRLRKKAAEEGFMPKASAATSTKGPKAKKGESGKKGGVAAEGSELDFIDDDDDDTPAPPITHKTHPGSQQKVLTGRVTKGVHQPAKKNSAKPSKDVKDALGNDDDATEAGDSVEYEQEDITEHIKVEE